MAIVGYEWSLILFVVMLIVVIYIIRALLRRRPVQYPSPVPAQVPPTVIKEREVIKEVVMVPCRYCGGLMPQASLFCPNCGARRQ